MLCHVPSDGIPDCLRAVGVGPLIHQNIEKFDQFFCHANLNGDHVF